VRVTAQLSVHHLNGQAHRRPAAPGVRPHAGLPGTHGETDAGHDQTVDADMAHFYLLTESRSE
jgi:hypothetical protein